MNSATTGHHDQRRRARPRRAAANPGDGAEQEKPRDPSGRPTEDPAQAALPHREPVGAPNAEAHPRLDAGQLHRQLAAEHDDGADVLERRGEAQLSDERRAPLGCFDGHIADEVQPERDRAGRQHELQQCERLELQRPEQEAAEDRARLPARRERADDRGSDQHHGQQRALPGPAA